DALDRLFHVLKVRVHSSDQRERRRQTGANIHPGAHAASSLLPQPGEKYGRSESWGRKWGNWIPTQCPSRSENSCGPRLDHQEWILVRSCRLSKLIPQVVECLRAG